ncbi:MAG: undecaprenyl-diphosphate phosphatase [Rhodospirillaceae bacterium]|nr:undecaprenyl-diphosphate phosphatase [Rhodospirillaceae bacterium]
MPLLEIVVLALVQGLTEFLPISSSAHLVLVPALLGWSDQGVAFDISVHVGTLAAVVIYFRRDVAALVVGAVALLGGRVTPAGRLAVWLVLATIPVVAAGMALHAAGPDLLRSVEVLAWATLVFGLMLYVADRYCPTGKDLGALGWSGALWIGLAQVLALIPGTSRSGITMTAGRALGLNRQDAARFSLLLSIPTILGAGVLATKDLVEAGDASLGLDAVLGAVLSFVFALIAIAAMMAWLRRASFTPFVVYRVLLGLGLLIWIYA